MKKLIFGISVLGLMMAAGCQKNDCQTFLQGAWVVVNPNDSARIGIDSVFFFKGDSIREKYKGKGANDTFQYYYSSYFINDFCNGINFNGTNTWSQGKAYPLYYNILEITPDHFTFLSRTDSGICTTCNISMHR